MHSAVTCGGGMLWIRKEKMLLVFVYTKSGSETVLRRTLHGNADMANTKDKSWQ
jgi:hypothetical protein